MARSHRRKAPLALVVLDVDHFKHVNDTVGHQAGDGERLVAAADAALYSAKREGRDRSVGSNRVQSRARRPNTLRCGWGAGAPERLSRGG